MIGHEFGHCVAGQGGFLANVDSVENKHYAESNQRTGLPTPATNTDYVTVNALLPSYGGIVYAGRGRSGGYWLPLVEKAYAQWNATGREGRDGQNAMRVLMAAAWETVDGRSWAARRRPTPRRPARRPSRRWPRGESGAAVTAAIFTNGDAGFNQLGLFTGHAYLVAGYDSDPASAMFGDLPLEKSLGFRRAHGPADVERVVFVLFVVCRGRPPPAAANSPAADPAAIHAAAPQAMIAGRQNTAAAAACSRTTSPPGEISPAWRTRRRYTPAPQTCTLRRWADRRDNDEEVQSSREIESTVFGNAPSLRPTSR